MTNGSWGRSIVTDKMLLENGADVNVANNDGDSPLITACSGGGMKITGLLLEEEWDVNVEHRNKKGESALSRAALRSVEEFTQILEKTDDKENTTEANNVAALFKLVKRLRTLSEYDIPNSYAEKFLQAIPSKKNVEGVAELVDEQLDNEVKSETNELSTFLKYLNAFKNSYQPGAEAVSNPGQRSNR